MIDVVLPVLDEAEALRWVLPRMPPGYRPIVVVDACGGRDQVARERSVAGLAFAGDSILTDTATLCQTLRK